MASPDSTLRGFSSVTAEPESGMGIGLLDEQPFARFGARGARGVLGLPAESDERKPAAQLVARKFEVEFAGGEALGRVVFEIAHRPRIPHNHGACPVVAHRDDRFEFEILERMWLGVDGEPTFRGIEARTARDGKGLEHARYLETQVVMPVGGVVQVNDESAEPRLGHFHRTVRRFSAERLIGMGH